MTEKRKWNWRDRDQERQREHQKRWREKNRARLREYDQAYHAANAEARREAVRRWRAENPLKAQSNYAKRRARKKGARVEDLDYQAVFERDKYVCQICGRRTHGRYPALTSASLDHIIPLSRGGAHSYANTQCACLGCNVRKGTALGEQSRAELHEQLSLTDFLRFEPIERCLDCGGNDVVCSCDA